MAYNLKTIKEQFKKEGIFYTSPELALKLKSYIDVPISNVYDPTCGDGGLLQNFPNEIKKYGQEKSFEQLEVAKQNLVNFEGVCGDTLESPAFMDMQFDCILANPPFSISWQPKMDSRFESVKILPPPSKADFAFVLHCLHLLNKNGVAIILGFPGILYRSGKEGQIRQWLVEQNYISKVVEIAGGMFVDTKISTVILVLKKNKVDDNIEFIDDSNNIAKTVSIEEIKDNDYNLSVKSYVKLPETEKEKIDPVALEMLARKQFLNKLKQDLEFSKYVCGIEGLDFGEYLNEIQNVLKEFYKNL